MKLPVTIILASAVGLSICRVIRHADSIRNLRVSNSTRPTNRTQQSFELHPFISGDGLPKITLTAPPQATDEEFKKCREKGNEFVCAMPVNSNEAGRFFTPPLDTTESKWKSDPAQQDLDDWGYNLYDATEESEKYGQFDQFWGIGRALRAKGLSDKLKEQGGKNVVHYVLHGDIGLEEDIKNPVPVQHQMYFVGGRKYYCTRGFFAFAMNYDQGVIMAMNRKSPRYAVKSLNPPWAGGALPELIASSDIMWGIWKDGAYMDSRNIRYFLSLSITNEPTSKIIYRVVKGVLPAYPGVKFSSDTPDGMYGPAKWMLIGREGVTISNLSEKTRGQALLGTPNGLAIGYMLVQHKADIGLRYVKEIEVFKCDTVHESPCMLFSIEEVKEEKNFKKSGDSNKPDKLGKKDSGGAHDVP
ncbi:hypothetical protein N0V90_006520 [Kalmusia sp. IMI 367209]|nr:hypothetical protein N0V90_006520 [Kalmusia sp. IMI 367209]